MRSSLALLSTPSSLIKVATDIGGSTAKCAILLPKSKAHLVTSSFKENTFRCIDAAEPVRSLACRELGLDNDDHHGDHRYALKFIQCSASLRDVAKMFDHLCPSSPLGALLHQQQQQQQSESHGTGGNAAGKHVRILSTGGGSFNFAEEAKTRSIDLNIVPEMAALVEGISAIAKTKSDKDTPLFSYCAESKRRCAPRLAHGAPILLVNIGSGISFIKIEPQPQQKPGGDDVLQNIAAAIRPKLQFERVGGSSIGGATFFGLSKALCNVESWDDMKQIFTGQAGQRTNVDLLVGDIYSHDKKRWGDALPLLDSNLLAASFGKIASSSGAKIDRVLYSTKRHHAKHFEAADLLQSLISMMCYNTTQLSHLYAEKHKCESVVFSGGFVAGAQTQDVVMSTLATSLSYWGTPGLPVHGHFIRGSQFVGALGAMLS